MEVTRNMTAAEAANNAGSISEAIQLLAGKHAGQNMVRLHGDYEAEAAGNAFARKAVGESGRGQGFAVGQQMIRKTTGTSFDPKGNKATVIVGWKDKTSRTSDGKKFAFRTYTVCDLGDPTRTITNLEVCQIGGKWEVVSFEGKAFFPALPIELEENFQTERIDLQEMGQKISALVKKADYIKAKVRKLDNPTTTALDGSKAHYVPPKGDVIKIVVTETGENIPTIQREVFKIQLTVSLPALDAEKVFPADWLEFVPKAIVKSGKNKGQIKAGTDQWALRSDLEMLPVYMAAIDRLRDEYSDRYEKIRHYELGVIERARDSEGGTFPETVVVGGTVFEIEVNTAYESDQPLDTAAKIESGEYRKDSVPTTKGKWIQTPAPITQKV